MNITVLCGGTSTERTISISSGTNVAVALRKNGHKVFMLDVFFGCNKAEADKAFKEEQDFQKAAEAMKGNTEKVPKEIDSGRAFIGENVLELCKRSHITFLALHGSNGEDGKIQAAFDLLGIRYTGTDYLSSAIAMDKVLTKQILREWKICTPYGGMIEKTGKDTAYAQFGLKLPVVVKPCCGGSSIGVSIVRNDQEYEEALQVVFSLESRAVVEEYVEGREFSVAVVGGEAYPVIEITPKEGFYDYRNKYSPGSTIETCPAKIPYNKTIEMQKMAVEGAKALGIRGYSRLDFIMNDQEKIFLIEANTLPGMTPTSLIPQEAAVLGMSFEQLCERIIEVSK